ncbi:hypothetical protein RB213_005858 [Colletotrichum asianum]
MSIYLSLNEELHNNLNKDAIFTPGDMWQSEDEDNEGEDRGVRGTTRETQQWAINHSTTRFIQRVLAKDFKSIDALKMMQEKHTINFRLHRAGPIFDNITMSFQQWSALYGVKHISRIPFNVTRRTFRIAQASTRET